MSTEHSGFYFYLHLLQACTGSGEENNLYSRGCRENTISSILYSLKSTHCIACRYGTTSQHTQTHTHAQTQTHTHTCTQARARARAHIHRHVNYAHTLKHKHVNYGHTQTQTHSRKHTRAHAHSSFLMKVRVNAVVLFLWVHYLTFCTVHLFPVTPVLPLTTPRL